MTPIEALDRLIEAVKAGDDAFVRGAGWIAACDLAFPSRPLASMALTRGQAAYDGDMNAAMALCGVLLQGQSFGMTVGGEYGATVTFPSTWDRFSVTESNLVPARALLIATLMACRAEAQP